MNYCDCKNDCGCDPCGNKKPAQYGCDFDVQVDPFDPNVMLFVTNGAIRKVRFPSNFITGKK